MGFGCGRKTQQGVLGHDFVFTMYQSIRFGNVHVHEHGHKHTHRQAVKVCECVCVLKFGLRFRLHMNYKVHIVST